MSSLLGPDGQEINKDRPREFANEAFAEMMAHLFPDHGFMVCEKEDGTKHVIHFEHADGLCGGIMDVKREADGSDPSMNCSKCGRIRSQMPKPHTIKLEEEVGRHIYVPPGLIQEN